MCVVCVSMQTRECVCERADKGMYACVCACVSRTGDGWCVCVDVRDVRECVCVIVRNCEGV